MKAVDMLTDAQCRQFHEDGYLRIQNVFSETEMERFRAAAATAPSGLYESLYLYESEFPEILELWADKRLVEVAQQLLGGPAIYFFEGNLVRYDFGRGVADKARHLHHDAKGTRENIHNRVNEAQTETFPALRFAIYLQDTEIASGGLKVAAGSHKIDVSTFENRDIRLSNVKSKPGDVIVFTHRILHSPLALRLRDDPEKALWPHEEEALLASDPHRFLPIPQIRECFFIDYVSSDETADLYVKNRALYSSDPKNKLAEQLVDGGLLDKYRDLGIPVRVDRALISTIKNIFSHIKEGVVDPEGILHLKRLPRLCQAHFETSPYHRFHDSDVADLSIETALRLYDEIAQRMASFQDQFRTKTKEPHMSPGHRAATAPPVKPYNPARWQDFHHKRKLRCPSKKILKADTKIFAMGSCFAMQIRRAMARLGLEVYPNYAAISYDRSAEVLDKMPERESLQHYDTFSIRQEFEAAFGLWGDRKDGYWPVRNAPVNQLLGAAEVFQDPYRKLVYAKTPETLTGLADRVTASIREGLDRCTVAVLTLGLTEVWRHNQTGKYLCKPPGTGYGGGVGQATFRQSTFIENYENVRAALEMFFARYPEKHVVISVSPVGLDMTFSQYDVGTANNESKAILRAVAGQICREFENAIYFPSYEMATILKKNVYEDDGRHVLQSFADEVVATFVSLMS